LTYLYQKFNFIAISRGVHIEESALGPGLAITHFRKQKRF